MLTKYCHIVAALPYLGFFDFLLLISLALVLPINSTNLHRTGNSVGKADFTSEESSEAMEFQPVGSTGAGVLGKGDALPAYSDSILVTTQNSADVLYVSPRGDDANVGNTSESPLRTVNAAVMRASAGTTVYVEGGTYFEQIITRRGGAPGKEIVVTSYNGLAVIDGSRLSWAAGDNQNQGLVELRHPHVRLNRLRVVNSKNTGVVLDADDLTVENCEVGETQRHGISTDTKRQTNYPGMKGTMIRNVLLRNNTVYRAVLKGEDYGQAVSLIADGFTISGNTVRDNFTEGIDIWLGARHGEVVDNEIYGNAKPGIYIDGASDIRVHRNRVFNNLKGIGVSSEDVNYATNKIWVYNNLVYDNKDAGLFIWDSSSNPGFHGSQNVIFADNTLANNKHSVYLSGDGNSAEITNNVGSSTGPSLYNSSTNSAYNVHDNLWLS